MFSNFSINGTGLSGRVPFLPVNSVWQPALYRDDMRLSKILPFGDRYKLYLSLEVFNISNSWSPTVPETGTAYQIYLRSGSTDASGQPATGLRRLPGLRVFGYLARRRNGSAPPAGEQSVYVLMSSQD